MPPSPGAQAAPGARVRLTFACIALQWGLASAALATPAAGPVHLATVFDGPSQLMADVEALVVPSLSVGIDVTSHRRYMAMADQLGVMWPYAPIGARRVGRALHLTHVVLFRVITQPVEQTPQSRLLVRLVDVRTGALAVDEAYHLSQSTFAPATAARVLAVLRWQLLAEKADLSAPLPEDWRPESRRRAAAPPQLGRRRGPRDAKRAKHADTARQDDAAPWRQAPAGRRKLMLGVSLALRQAQLSPAGAPCYCIDGGFAPAIPGLHLKSSLYFDPNTTHFGVEAELGGGLANLPVTGGAAGEVSITQAWHMGAAIGYRVFDSKQVTLVPQIGMTYARFPIAQGPFVGTAYTTVAFGMQLLGAPLARHVQLAASGGFSLVVQAGDELRRLGQLQSGTAWYVEATPSLLFNRWQLALRLAVAQINSHFRGTTALYAPQIYNNVSLTDTTTTFELAFGSQFW